MGKNALSNFGLGASLAHRIGGSARFPMTRASPSRFRSWTTGLSGRAALADASGWHCGSRVRAREGGRVQREPTRHRRCGEVDL